MYMKLSEIIAINKRLDKATVNSLEESDAIRILKARKSMRPYVIAYKDFEKDCQEKFMFEGIEDAEKVRIGVVEKANADKSYIPTEEEMEAIKQINEYFAKVNKALAEELDRDIDIELPKLSENADVKLMHENKWTFGELDEIEAIL